MLLERESASPGGWGSPGAPAASPATARTFTGGPAPQVKNLIMCERPAGTFANVTRCGEARMLRGAATLTAKHQPAARRGVPWMRRGVISVRLRGYGMSAMCQGARGQLSEHVDPALAARLTGAAGDVCMTTRCNDITAGTVCAVITAADKYRTVFCGWNAARAAGPLRIKRFDSNTALPSRRVSALTHLPSAGRHRQRLGD